MEADKIEQKPSYFPFIEAWRKRISERKKSLSTYRKEAHQQAEKAALILQREYGIKRIFLFGSLLDETRFTERSDIDLAVEGLEGSALFDAVGRLLQDSKFNIELLPWEDCKASLKREILLNGKILYERPQQREPEISKVETRDSRRAY